MNSLTPLDANPDYAAAQDRLNKINDRMAELKATKEAILGKISESQRDARERDRDEAAEQVWKTGSFAPVSTEFDHRLRQNLKAINEELRVLEKAQRLGHREQLDIRAKLSREVTEEHRDEYRERVVAIARAAVALGEAVAAERSFFDAFDRAGYFPSFSRIDTGIGLFDLTDSGTIPSRFVYAAIQAGALTGKESWIKDRVQFDGNQKLKPAK